MLVDDLSSMSVVRYESQDPIELTVVAAVGSSLSAVLILNVQLSSQLIRKRNCPVTGALKKPSKALKLL